VQYTHAGARSLVCHACDLGLRAASRRETVGLAMGGETSVAPRPAPAGGIVHLPVLSRNSQPETRAREGYSREIIHGAVRTRSEVQPEIGWSPRMLFISANHRSILQPRSSSTKRAILPGLS
jgi:hypothetical protein